MNRYCFGFEPVQNFIMVVGKLELKEKNIDFVPNRTIGK
jgi:hypothetical protein